MKGVSFYVGMIGMRDIEFRGSSAVERSALDAEVAGSNPTPGAILLDAKQAGECTICGTIFWIRWAMVFPLNV